jgi:hypothetical protein
MEGSGSGSVQIHYESGCGYRRPKNMWVLRIRNTVRNLVHKNKSLLSFEEEKNIFLSPCHCWPSPRTTRARQRRTEPRPPLSSELCHPPRCLRQPPQCCGQCLGSSQCGSGSGSSRPKSIRIYADPDPEHWLCGSRSGAFLALGFGIQNYVLFRIPDPGSRIPNPYF